MKQFQSSWADIQDENSNGSMASVEFGDLPLKSISKSRSRTGGGTYLDPDFDNSRAGVNALIKGNMRLGEDTLSNHSRKRTRDGLDENNDSQPGNKKQKASSSSKQKSSTSGQFNFSNLLQETNARKKSEAEKKDRELMMNVMPPLVPTPTSSVTEMKVPENGSGDFRYALAAPAPGQQTQKNVNAQESGVTQVEHSSPNFQNFNAENAINAAPFGGASPRSIKSGNSYQFFAEPPVAKAPSSAVQPNFMFTFQPRVPVASPADNFVPAFLQRPPPPPGNPATIGFPTFPIQQPKITDPQSPNNTQLVYKIPAGAVVQVIGPDGEPIDALPVTHVIANNNVQPLPVQFPVVQNYTNTHRNANRGMKNNGRGGGNASGRSSRNSSRTNTPSSKSSSSAGSSNRKFRSSRWSSRKNSGYKNSGNERKELTEHQIDRRQVNINRGKGTAGYRNYVATVARGDRKRGHPRTPDARERISKRRFDGKIRCWRRQLHAYDHLAASKESRDLRKGSMSRCVESDDRDHENIMSKISEENDVRGEKVIGSN